MKRALIGILLAFTVWLSISYSNSPEEESHQPPTPHENETLEPARVLSISRNGNNFHVYYTKISGRQIDLIPNFDTQKSALRLAKEHNCTVASSGGFYTKEQTPLGLFRTDGKTHAPNIAQSNLVNGYFYITSQGTPQIGQYAPEDAPTILQTGPYFSSGSVFPARSDEQARRIVLLEDTSGAVYVAAIVSSHNSFSGPLLAHLPEVLFSIADPFVVRQALNLDGGAASYYQDEGGFSLPELTYIGSLICIK